MSTFQTDDRPADLERDGRHHAELEGFIPCEKCGDYCLPLSQGWCEECWEDLGATIQEGGNPVWPERRERVNA